jgi:TPP-dependent pyruvate/acetoin dehydrogenase alpha subunit
MKSNYTVEDLKNFEIDVAGIFNSGKIKAPVHLSDGNEAPLIEIFKHVKDEDWVICSWRSHYQCLLKGVPKDVLLDEIKAGRSISLCFPDYQIFSSAIVGGQIPIAVGLALAEKRKKSSRHIWCFIGDMTSETGMAATSIRYAEKHDLPITFVIEDNGLSVLTDTRKVWNTIELRYESLNSSKIISFKYKSSYPHAGAGVRVQF